MTVLWAIGLLIIAFWGTRLFPPYSRIVVAGVWTAWAFIGFPFVMGMLQGLSA